MKNPVPFDDAFEAVDLSSNGFDRQNLLSEVIQFCLTALGLVAIAPLFLVIALAIKVTSRGPLFYQGIRVGRGQKLFKIYKFRTLRVGSEEKIGARLLTEHDHFYTGVGRFLKRTKLDELPQLLNVIKGEMNLVGPRPIRPIFLERLSTKIANYNARFGVKPGLTGLAQVKGGYFTDPKDKLRYELVYVKNRSLFFDLKLIFLTLVKLLNRLFTLGFLSLAMFLFVSFVPDDFLPSHHTYPFGIRFNLLHLFIIFGGACLLIKRIPKNKLYLYRSSVYLPIFTFFLFTLATSYFALQPFTSLRGAVYYAVTGFLIVLLIVNGETTRRFIRNAARVIALATVAVSLIGLFHLFLMNHLSVAQADIGSVTENMYLPRMVSTLDNPVILATYLVLGLPLLLAELSQAGAGKKRDFWLICTTVTFVGILLTQTRISLIALGVTGSVFLYKRSKRLCGAFLLGFALLFFFLVSVPGSRYSPRLVLGEVSSALARTTAHLSEVPVERLLIGFGTKNFKNLDSSTAIPPFSGKEQLRKSLPPNMHLILLLENGILGWLLMIWILFAALKTLWSAYAKVKERHLQMILWAIFSSIVGFLVSMNNVDAFFDITIQVLFWGLLGIGMAIALRFSGGKNGFIRIWRFGD